MSSSQNKRTNKSGGNAAGAGSGSGKGSGKGPAPVHPHMSLPCPICLLPIEQPAITKSGHIFCFSCLNMVARSSFFPRCPFCRKTL